jgi:hypothetical protein
MGLVKDGIVKGSELAAPLRDVSVCHYNSNGDLINEVLTDSSGHWKLSDLHDQDKIVFKQDGYVTKSYSVNEIPDMVRLLQDRLIGYQEKLWFKPGEKVTAHIHAPEKFQAVLYRHGLQKKLVFDVGAYPLKQQNIPDDFFVEHGLSWEPNFTYTIPESAQPGIYSLLLESEHQEPFAIPFVVSTPEKEYGKSKILVLSSTNNWQSYNIWGGRSRYRNYEDITTHDYIKELNLFYKLATTIAEKMPPALILKIKQVLGIKKAPPEWKFKRLSIKRPFTNCYLEEKTPFQPFTNHLAAGEWRVLAWLEREGYDYDIISGFELHQNPDLLKYYKGMICSTHCEYWSVPMYEGLKKYHQANGLWILNISGNTLYREVDFYEDGSHHCTSLKFHESAADETQLIGVRFTESDYGTCAPFRITDRNHWVFKDIPLNEENDTFGYLSLNQNTSKITSRYDPGRPGVEFGLKGAGASGWETDKLSSTAPKDFHVVAKGLNKWGGSDMVVREPNGKRGGVFSVSSITFGGSLLIDDVCSKTVKNVLDKVLKI